jgi:hypothetical protein
VVAVATFDLEFTINLKLRGAKNPRNNLFLTGEIYTVKVPGGTVEARSTSVTLELPRTAQLT